MIKLAFRKNQIYLILLSFSYLIRRILSILLKKIFGMSNSLIFCYLMCLGQFFGGLTIFLYQSAIVRNKGIKSEQKGTIKLILTKRKMHNIDSKPKIYFLIFLASFFDYEEFLITLDFIPRTASLSSTADLRLSFIMTISSAIICKYALKFKIGKHQIISLIALNILSFIIIILEFIYKPKDINLSSYATSYILLILHFVFRSYTDTIEKYLGEYDFVSPFKMIMTEGISTFILTFIYSILKKPLKQLIDIYNKLNTGEFVVLTFLLFLYFLFCSFVNIYKTYCNVLYSPITKSLASYFLNLAFIIYYYAFGNDFLVEGEKNVLYFLLNLLFSVFIDFLGLIYNEFFILNFCGLSSETYQGITIRAIEKEMKTIQNENLDHDTIIDGDNN